MSHPEGGPPDAHRPDKPSAVFTTSVTEQHGAGLAHLVDEYELAVISSGWKPQAICGSVFLPAALTAPVGSPCALCRAITTVSPPQRPRSRSGRRFPFLRSSTQ